MQNRSKAAISPWSMTPLTRNMVTGSPDLRTAARNTSWRRTGFLFSLCSEEAAPVAGRARRQEHLLEEDRLLLLDLLGEGGLDVRQVDRLGGHDRRDGVLVDELRLPF